MTPLKPNSGGQQIHLRSCGLITKGDHLLLVQLRSPVRENPIWIPPGGRPKPGEPVRAALEREITEETGLTVCSGRLSFIHQLIEFPLHALEFYFLCEVTGGELKLGNDPERNSEGQILLDLAYIPFGRLSELAVYPEILRERAEELTRPNGEVVTLM